MKICHICLCGYFNEGFGYQDNFMVEENVKDRHEVTIIASEYQMKLNGKVEYEEVKEKIVTEGAKIYRIPFKYKNDLINNKLRIYKGLYRKLEAIKPEIIFVHGIQFVDLKEIVKYKKTYPKVKVYADNHASFHNSANGFISRNIQHKMIYKYYIKKSEKYIEKFFNVTYDCEKLMKKLYKVNNNLEYLPLCGKYIEDNEYEYNRNEIRNSLGIKQTDRLYIHAGKLDKKKKSLETLSKFYDSKEKIIVIGSIDEEIKDKFLKLIESNKNIYYLGWKSSDDLIKYLCAADIFIQIGSQSILFQQAISCRNMVILDKNINTEYLVSYNNGILVKNDMELESIINSIADEKINYKSMGEKSKDFAKNELNYSKQSQKYLGGKID